MSKCKDRCLTIQVEGRYADGLKRCQTCCVFLKVEGFRCPCCGQRLRTYSHQYPSTKRYLTKTQERSS